MPAGRPTKWKEEYCEIIIEYFSGELYKEKADREEIPISFRKFFPTVAGFCAMVGIAKHTFQEWQKKYPEFSAAVSKAKTFQEANLVENTLFKNFDGKFAQFVAKNYLNMEDKQKVEVSGNMDTKFIKDADPETIRQKIDDYLKEKLDGEKER